MRNVKSPSTWIWSAMAPNANIVVFGTYSSPLDNIGSNGMYENIADYAPLIPTVTSSFFTGAHAQMEPGCSLR